MGQADSTLIIMGEDVMLIDAGDKTDGEYIVEFLKSQGVEEIDYLIETHSDDDHSGGIEKNSTKFRRKQRLYATKCNS